MLKLKIVAVVTSLCIAAYLTAPLPATAAPIRFSTELDGYSIGGQTSDDVPVAAECPPGISCPPLRGITRRISLTIKKPAKPLDIIIIPDIRPEDTALVDNVIELAFVVAREAIDEAIEEKQYLLGKIKLFKDLGEDLSEYLSELTEVGADTARYDAMATFAPGYSPYAAALVLYDPETDTAQSVVALFVPEPGGILLFSVGLLGLIIGRPRRTMV